MIEADIAVIGGGSAGFCAAIAAARRGRKVVLLEKSDRLGGMGTLAMVHTFCGLYHPDTSRPPETVNPGLPAEIEALMRKRTGASPVKMGKVYVLPQDPEIFAQIALELCSAEPQLTVLFGSECRTITQNPDDSFTVKSKDHTIRVHALIDTSSHAIGAKLLGATRISPPEKNRQRCASIFSLDNVPNEALTDSFRMKLALAIVRAVQSGTLPPTALGTASRASTRPGEVFFTTDLDPAPDAELSETGKNLAAQLTAFLRDTSELFRHATGPKLAYQPGIRETFQWKGKYTLTAEDLISGQSFPDTVAWASWPLELRETTRGPKLTYFSHNAPSAIPLRALTSAEIPHVFFAGRCLSATHEAQASLRVMGTCFATGQAAGIAAHEVI